VREPLQKMIDENEEKRKQGLIQRPKNIMQDVDLNSISLFY